MEHPRRRFSDKVFNAIPGYLTVQDRDFKIIEANDAFKRNFGDFSGKYCYQIYKHRPERCEDCPVDRTFRDGQKHRSDEIVTTLDGREVNVLVYTTPIFDDDGNVNEVVEMSTDVTEIKQLQKQFKDSQARYHQLFEESPCFISIQDESLNVGFIGKHLALDTATSAIDCINIVRKNVNHVLSGRHFRTAGLETTKRLLRHCRASLLMFWFIRHRCAIPMVKLKK